MKSKTIDCRTDPGSLNDVKLFGNANAKPRSQGGLGTWLGHIKEFLSDQIKLSKTLQEYKNKGCNDDIPPDCQAIVNLMAPAMPNNVNPFPIPPLPRSIPVFP